MHVTFVYITYIKTLKQQQGYTTGLPWLAPHSNVIFNIHIIYSILRLSQALSTINFIDRRFEHHLLCVGFDNPTP